MLLDQKLRGPGGSDSGLELIAQVHGLAPFAKTIIVTGYPAHEAIERAFGLGVYDYRATTGFFFAVGGFTEGFHARRTADRTSARKALVIPVGAADLDRWITSDDRAGVLTELYKRAVFASAR